MGEGDCSRFVSYLPGLSMQMLPATSQLEVFWLASCSYTSTTLGDTLWGKVRGGQWSVVSSGGQPEDPSRNYAFIP